MLRYVTIAIVAIGACWANYGHASYQRACLLTVEISGAAMDTGASRTVWAKVTAAKVDEAAGIESDADCSALKGEWLDIPVGSITSSAETPKVGDVYRVRRIDIDAVDADGTTKRSIKYEPHER